MVKSTTIKNIQNLNLKGTINLSNEYGYISNTKNSIIVSGETFEIYDCEFNHNFEDDIVVNLSDGTDYAVTRYKKVKKFKAYYNRKNNLFLVEAPNKVANAFIKRIEKDLKITINPFYFNFIDIIQRRNTTKVVNFKVEDINIDNKTFNGTDVEHNTEVLNALENNRGTYMLVSMDIANIQRSIGFSQRGVIVIQNNLIETDVIPYPYLQCTFDILLALGAI